MSEHGHHSEFEGIGFSDVTDDIAKTLTTTTWKYWLTLGLVGLYVIYGAVVYYIQTTIGLGFWNVNEPTYWGLDIPTFIFWIGFSLCGTLLSGILLLTKSHWRNPVYRSAEIATVVALLVAQVVVLTHTGRPWRALYATPTPNLRLLFQSFRSVLSLDIMGFIGYLVGGLIFLIMGSIPDFASLRDRTTGWRKGLYTVLSFGWIGSALQWRHFRSAYLLGACLILPIAISMHTVTSWVPSMLTNPATRSTIFPFYFVTGALLSGMAGVIIISAIIRKALGLEKYLKVKYFDHLSKLVLLASFGISYIYLIEIIIPWYKHGNLEWMPMAAKMTSRYSPLFWGMVFLNSVVPMGLFFRKIRQNLFAIFLISVGIEVAMYFERVLMIIPTLSIGYLPSTWAPYFPNWVEFSLAGWSFSLFIFIYLLIAKIIPVMAIAEIKELIPFRKRSELKHKSAKKVTLMPEIAGGSGAASEPVKPLLGVFQFIDDATDAIKQLKQAGLKKIEAHTPAPSDEIEELLAPEPVQIFSTNPKELAQILPKLPQIIKEKLINRDIHISRISFLGMMIGISAGVGLSVVTTLLFPIKTGHMPMIAIPPTIYLAYVLMCLVGLIFTLIGMIVLGKPSIRLKSYDKAASYDRITVVVSDINVTQSASVKAIFSKSGAERIVEGEA